MLLDRSKEEIARELLARATECWGAERAEDLRKPIEDAATSLSLIARYTLELDGDEPDFLVAPATREGSE